MKKLLSFLFAVCFLCVFSVGAFASQNGGVATPNYDSLKGQKIDTVTAKQLLEKAQNGDITAKNFLFSMDAFNPEKYNMGLQELSGRKAATYPARYTFADGSFVEVGTCIPGTSLITSTTAPISASNTSASVIRPALSYPMNCYDEKYVGIGVGSLYFGAYFIRCDYYCSDHNHASYRSCSDRSEAVYPYQITANGCSCTKNGLNDVEITGTYWYSGGIYNRTEHARLYCFPQLSSNYMTKL